MHNKSGNTSRRDFLKNASAITAAGAFVSGITPVESSGL